MRVQNRSFVVLNLATLLVVAVLLVATRSPWAPSSLIVALAMGLPTWSRAWRATSGTALRGAIAWAGMATGLAMAAQVAAILEGPHGSGPWAARIAYLMTLAILAGLVSVLGARNPGGGAWAILMALLVVVFLVPWLEAGGRIGRGAAAAGVLLSSPWTVFYGLLAMASVTNYLPTRYGPSAAALGLALGLEYLGLTRPEWGAAARHQAWLGVAWFLALAAALAGWAGARRPSATNRVDVLWRWFRDHWGVVWALRVQERFNRSAELAAWPVRLTWYGLVSAAGDGPDVPPGEIPEAAEATLRTLLRRFAGPACLEAVMRMDRPEACHGDGAGR